MRPILRPLTDALNKLAHLLLESLRQLAEKLASVLTRAKAAKETGSGPPTVGPRASQRAFPKEPSDLLPEIPRNPKGHVQPSEYLRIRPEKHPLIPGETFAPRHHGQHYHVEIRIDPSKSWNSPKNVIKVEPPGYTPGQGKGFLPGEPFPGM